MHELTIARSIISIAEKTIPPGSKGVVTAVSVQIGELSTVDIPALEFAFTAMREGTLLEKAVLQAEKIPGEAECQDCHTIFPMNNWATSCPGCGGFSLRVLKGREMKVLSISIDDPAGPDDYNHTGV